MHKSVPLWLFLFTLLSFAVLTVAISAAVKAEIEDDERGGVVGDLALRVASIPGIARTAVGEAHAYLSQTYDRHLVVPSFTAEEAAFRPVATAPGLALDGLIYRADTERMAHGWRVLVGTFDRDGTFAHGAVLLSPDLTAVHFWSLNEAPLPDTDVAPPHRRFPHGLAVLPDGSVIFAFDGGTSLQRFDACGDTMWRLPGGYHHAVTLTEDGEHVWTLRGDALVQVRVDDGTVVRELEMEEVVAANPDIDILEVRRFHENDLQGNRRGLEEKYLTDPFHLNDVDPLPATLADRFEGFEAGDLLVSARSLNLVFVVDPQTAEVKWWRSGAWKRQHDPDWLPSGAISVFDNQMNRGPSRIVEIDPATFATEVSLDGEAREFYTRVRGKHQRLPSGALLATSSQQARAFELAPDGALAFEVRSMRSDNAEFGYSLSDYIWLEPDALSLPAGC